MANKLLGQHFLKSPAIAEKIVRAIAPQPQDIIFEIGAGHGELTFPLARACMENGSKLFSIEKDPKLAVPRTENGEMIHDDALAFFASESFKKEAARRPYKVVGNIPYYLTGRILRMMSEAEHHPARCVFMVQEEVAERIIARPPRMNRLAASIQFWATPAMIAAVPKESFRPVPNVDSAIIVLDAKKMGGEGSAAFSPRYYAAMRALFAQPRQTILNNLKRSGGDKGKIAAAIRESGLDPGARPQNVSIESIIKIAETLF